jgi:TfoX/Sxy family transcriptional regulator of competence genes
MASDPAFVDYDCDQMSAAGSITSRKMFGDWAVYCDGKVVALICDDRLFIKPTLAGRDLIDDPIEAPPYPGAKPHLVIGERVDDREWPGLLVSTTARELPEPKPRKRKSG